ncbi:ketopantoate reductase PanE/ApbA C terminal-domain-containing protein [Corynascus similis CBS 632.67]
MDRGIHVLGLGNLGKYVAYALRRGHRTDIVPPLPPVTLFFHKLSLLRHWESAGRSISYIPELDTLPSEVRKHGRATGFRVELLGDAITGAQLGEIERHPDVTVGSDAPIKYLIVATKTIATTSAIAPVVHRLSKDSHIIFLQNGMGVADEVSEKLFPDPENRPTYWAGICSAGIYHRAPFTFVHAGTGPLSVGVVGARSQDPKLARLAMEGNTMVAQLLNAPLLDARLLSPDQILQAQVRKLVVNAVINPLTVIFGCKNGQLAEIAEASDMVGQLLQEAGPIAREMLPKADDLVQREFSDKNLTEVVWEVARKTANNTSSMLQDVRQGRPTEIDYINGYLVSSGKRLGLPTSNHADIHKRIKQLESEHANQSSRKV